MNFIKSILKNMLISGFIISSIGCSPRLKLSKDYENVNYVNFNELGSLVSDEEVRLPENLEEIVKKRHKTIKVNNRKKLEKFIYQEAENLGYSRKMIKSLDAIKSIELCCEISMNIFDWTDVDNKFKDKYELGETPLEDYVENKQGDCDKYTNLTLCSFYVFKKENPKLKNFYLSDKHLLSNLGIDPKHAWHSFSSVLYPTNENLYISCLDPTWKDNEVIEDLCCIESHFDKNSMKISLAYRLGDYENAADMMESLFSSLPKDKKNDYARARIFLHHLAFVMDNDKANNVVNSFEDAVENYEFEKSGVYDMYEGYYNKAKSYLNENKGVIISQ